MVVSGTNASTLDGMIEIDVRMFALNFALNRIIKTRKTLLYAVL